MTKAKHIKDLFKYPTPVERKVIVTPYIGDWGGGVSGYVVAYEGSPSKGTIFWQKGENMILFYVNGTKRTISETTNPNDFYLVSDYIEETLGKLWRN